MLLMQQVMQVYKRTVRPQKRPSEALLTESKVKYGHQELSQSFMLT